MGDKPSRPERDVREALHSTGTRLPLLEPLPRSRAARGSEPPDAASSESMSTEFDDEVTEVFARAL